MVVRRRFEFKFGESASYASQMAVQAHSKLSIIRAVQASDTDLPIHLDLRKEIHSADAQEARRRIGRVSADSWYGCSGACSSRFN
jgi:hypothetical protein